MSLITGVSWDHHEIFPTREDYQDAFKEFIEQTNWTLLWQDDNEYLDLAEANNLLVLDPIAPTQAGVAIAGQYNRLDAWLAVQAVHELTKEPLPKLVEIIDRFPGLSRRMEEIIPNLYSDYAHTP